MVSVLPHMTIVLLSNTPGRNGQCLATHDYSIAQQHTNKDRKYSSISHFKKKKAMNWYVIITEDKMLMMQSKSIMLLALL